MADDSQPAGAQVSDPPAQAIIHDPLPESNWLWRRIFAYATTSAVSVGVFMVVNSMVDMAHHARDPDLAVNAMVKIVGWLLLYGWCVTTYYLIAPTGEQITRWVQTAGMFKQGVGLTSTASATGDGQSASTTTTVNQAAPGTTAPDPPQPPDVPDAAPTAR